MDDAFDGLDPAAIHPRLKQALSAPSGRGHYFRECMRLRDEVKEGLRAALGIQHDLFILSNCTSGVMAAMLAIMLSNRQVIRRGERRQTYPLYQTLFPEASRASVWPAAAFATHVSPLTGRVDDLARHEEEILLVDGAQSFGTNLTDDLLRGADIFVAPLHKHVGLSVGAAVVGLRAETPGHARLSATFGMAETGSVHVGVLRELREAVVSAEGRFVNKARVTLDPPLRAICRTLGLAPLNASGHATPFICLTSASGEALDRVLVPERAQARFFRRENIVRLSFSAMGRRADPEIDFGGEAVDQLRAAALHG